MSTSRSVAGPFMGASIVLFLLSLTQTGYHVDGPDEAGWHPSVGLLVVGCLGPFTGVFAWLANPLLVATWIMMRSRSRRGTALCCAVASLGMSLSFLLHEQVMKDEAGHYARITGYGLGYWLWVASIITALAGCTFATLCDRSR